jgi:phage repressor protein C with HTH and peptisase S24 domain
MIDFKEFRSANNFTQKEAAIYFGVSQAFISQLEKKTRPIPREFISKIKADGKLIMPETSVESALPTKTDINNADDIIYIPLFPIAAQGGSLNDFIVSVKDSDCERIISPIKGADFAITVAGDSMSPEYPNGAQILIKKIDEKVFIDWGKVYVLDTCNGSVIKILAPSEREGYVKCFSINPDPKYASFEIAFEYIYGIYRVMLCYVCRLNEFSQ